jgi:hypothetical protein
MALDPANHSSVRFEPDQLESVLGLCRGPLLEGLSLSDAPDFELWLTAERDRLGQIYLAGLNRLLAGHRKAADWPAILIVAQRALAFDNGQETMHAALMEAYAHLGTAQPCATPIRHSTSDPRARVGHQTAACDPSPADPDPEWRTGSRRLPGY